MRKNSAKSVFTAALLLLLSLSPGRSAEGSGPLMNDVGNGALIWGTSSERTTYLGPYNALMAPKIGRLEEDDLSKDPLGSSERDRGELWKHTQEVGSVFGTDGLRYRYHYERAVQPRRVIERQVISGQLVDVEKIVWEPVLIRVLEPDDPETNRTKRVAEERSRNAAQGLAPCAPVKPCDPAKELNSTAPAANDPASQQPSLNSGDPQNAAQTASGNGQGKTVDPSNGDVDAIHLTMTSYDPGMYPAQPQTVIALPREAVRRAAPSQNEKTTPKFGAGSEYSRGGLKKTPYSGGQ